MIMVHMLLALLGVALFLYLLWGGADFGAGILETFSRGTARNQQRDVWTTAMGPVWEANHIWLVVVVVILFNGFPQVFYAVSIRWHLPLVALLFGIVLRGSAFAFRYYGVAASSSGGLYTFLYRFGSWLTPLVLGIIGGSLVVGKPVGSIKFYDVYVDPWWNPTAVVIGVWMVTLCAWVAAVYVQGERIEPSLRKHFDRLTWASGGAVVLVGGLVFAVLLLQDPAFVRAFFTSPVSLAAAVGATAIFVPLAWVLKKRFVWWPRILVSAQLGLVLSGWAWLQWKKGIVTHVGVYHLASAGAPYATQRYLLIALLVGVAIIFPSLAYLFRIFKAKGTAIDALSKR